MFSDIKIILFIIFVNVVFGKLIVEDTLIIHPITWETSSPQGWNAQYEKVVKFPDKDIQWRKIFLIQTLKCDSTTKGDQYPCGEWDYIWNILVDVPSADTFETFSLGSFVTPYGKRLKMGEEFGWEWIYDITDYASILIGDRKIIVGNNQELLDLKFLFIKGLPTRNILNVENIYPYGNYKYGDLSDDIILKEKKLFLFPNAKGYKIKSVISGHGHAGPRNCCEWDEKTHTYYIDDWQLFRWNIWKDCGNNPIYPQGGTWPFDRAGWCPGTKVDEFEFELTPFVKSADTIMIDYGIQPYLNDGEKEGDFRMSHQIIAYGAPNFSNDVAIIDIIKPSSKDKHSRFNPTLGAPQIIIKNEGRDDVKYLEIIYGLNKTSKSIYRWHGKLEFLEKEVINLPIMNWNGLNRSQVFEVEIKNPNKTLDENIFNNSLSSTVSIPQVFPTQFILSIKTNNLNRAIENSYTISDNYGKVYYDEDFFKDDTEYFFPIELKRGFYEFYFKDAMEDGISIHWWNRTSAPEKVGISGEVKFLDINGEILHDFDSDFGQELRFNFIIGQIP